MGVLVLTVSDETQKAVETAFDAYRAYVHGLVQGSPDAERTAQFGVECCLVTGVYSFLDSCAHSEHVSDDVQDGVTNAMLGLTDTVLSLKMQGIDYIRGAIHKRLSEDTEEGYQE